jgi:radical SAM superfamily enzyme YgiQ (UPF0313 family)
MPQSISSPPSMSASVSVGAGEAKAHRHRSVLFILPPFPGFVVAGYSKVMSWSGKKAPEPSLGLITVAGLLPQSWNMKHLDLSFQPLTEADWRDCDTVMMTGMSIQAEEIKTLTREAKRRGKAVVVGGPWAFHASSEAIAAGADLVVVGEAEGPMERLIECLDNEDFGHVLSSPARADMTRSPPPRWDLLDMHSYMALPIQFIRGCPFHCEFCDATALMGKEARGKGIQQVMDELQRLYELGWRGEVSFVDDNIIGNIKRVKELCRALIPWMRERDYPFEFQTQTSLNLAQKKDLLELMVAAGFTKTCVGIESLEQESLEETKKYQNMRVDQEAALRVIGRAGIRVKCTLIIGFDSEEPRVDERLIAFTERTRITDVLLNPLVAYPGTDLWKRLEREARLFHDSDKNLGEVARLPNFVPVRSIENIARELINFYEVVYEPERCLDRAFDQICELGPAPSRERLRWPKAHEWRLMLSVAAQHGVRNPTRWKFWRLLGAVARRSPEKVYSFLSLLAYAQNYFDHRLVVRREVSDAAERWSPEPIGLPSHI